MDGRGGYSEDNDNRWYSSDSSTGDSQWQTRRTDGGGTGRGAGNYEGNGYGARPYDESDEFAAPPRDASGAVPRDTSGSFGAPTRGRRAAADPLFTPDEAARFHAAQAAATAATAGPDAAQRSRSATPPAPYQAPAPGSYPSSGSGPSYSPTGATYPSSSGAIVAPPPGTSYGTGATGTGTGPIIGVPAGPMPSAASPYSAHIPAQPTGEPGAPTDAGQAGRTPLRAGDLTAPHELLGNELALGANPVAAPVRSENVYRARRPAVAIGLIVIASLVGLLFFRALMISAFGDTFLIPGVIASSLALGALPLLVIGLYALVTGAAHGAEQTGFRLWAKPPLAYLLVALVLLVAAGLAVG